MKNKSGQHRPWQRNLIVGVIMVCVSGLNAHDFWIEPSTYTPNPKQRVQVALCVGDHFKGQPVARNSKRIEKFSVLAPSSEHATPIIGKDGTDPAGSFVCSSPGLYTLIYDSNHASIELAADKFDAYLKEKGLHKILRDRQSKTDGKEERKAVREIYSRCAKALLFCKGEGSLSGDDRTIGLPLEITAKRNPYLGIKNQPIRFMVTFEGEPLPDMTVTARSSQHDHPQRKISDSEGMVSFNLTDQGHWLIECTYMRERPDLADTDYESFWASLTFEYHTRP